MDRRPPPCAAKKKRLALRSIEISVIGSLKRSPTKQVSQTNVGGWASPSAITTTTAVQTCSSATLASRVFIETTATARSPMLQRSQASLARVGAQARVGVITMVTAVSICLFPDTFKSISLLYLQIRAKPESRAASDKTSASFVVCPSCVVHAD